MFWRGLYVVGLLAVLGLGCTQSDSSLVTNDGSADSSQTAVLDLPAPDVEKLLNDVVSLYTNATGVRMKASLTQEVLDRNGQPIPSMRSAPMTRTFELQKPSFFRILPVETNGPLLINERNELLIYAPFLKNRLVRQPAVTSVASFVQNPELQAMGGPMLLFPLNFAVQNLQEMINEFNKHSYVGAESLRGDPTYHVQLSNAVPAGAPAAPSLHFWIAAEGQPVVRQIQFELGPQEIQVANGETRVVPLAVVDSFSDWEFNPKLEQDSWAAEIPKEAVEVTSFSLAESELSGREATEFEGIVLKGGTASLAQHRSKDIVLLDFWMIDCPPCRVEMPIVEKILKEFADQGVVGYAINPADKPAVIESFLKQSGLDLNVITDTDSTISKAYGVSGIPMLVLIDRQGIIQGVHLGFHQTLEAALRREIRLLIAGEPLKSPPITSEPLPPTATTSLPNQE